MSNSQITSQLTRVTVPSIGNSNFAEGIRNAFETINNNFKTIASLPFIQGVQGDSYTLISKDIWTEVNNNITPIYYALTKEGSVLLNSIFESVLDDTKKFHEGDSFDECKTNKLSDLSLNGVSPIDSFFTEENGVVKPVNNKLYFYSIINNLNEEQDTYLGQYFYFIDYRISELGNAYQDKKLSDFNDFTGFYQYQPANENEPEKYNAISIVPNLYYDKDKDDICWKYNGQQTGISAIGPKGLDGKDANFKIVYVKYTDDTENSGDILGYFDSAKGDIEYTDTLENCFCLVQFVNTETNEDNTVTITSYVDSAFGEVHNDKVYWENSLKMGNLFNNQNITKYFCNMGNTSTSIENHPYYFAIPAYLDRSDANTDNYKVGHVFMGSTEGNLILQKADNAFTEAGGQTPLYDLETESTQNLFDIKNYDINVDQNLSVGGTLGVTGTGTFNSDLSVGGTLGVSGTGTFNSDLSVGGTLGVSGTGTFNSDLSVGGTLGVSGTGTFNSDLTVRGTLGVSGTGTFNSDLSVGGTLGVSGTGTFNSDLTVRGTLGVSGTGTFNSDLTVGGTLGVTGNATIGGTLGVSGTGTFDSDLIVSGTLEVSDDAEVANSLTVNGGLYAKTKKPTSVVDGGTADGLSNVLVGHNDPGNSTFNDFPADLDKGGYPLVVKSLKDDGDESDGAIIIGSGDIYAISKTSTGWGPGTLHLNHRSNYFGDVRTGKNLFVGDSGRWGVGGNLTVCSNNGADGNLSVEGTENSSSTTSGALVVAGGVGISKTLYVGEGANISSNSINTVGLSVSGAQGSTTTGGVGIDVKGGDYNGTAGGTGGTGIVVKGGDSYHTSGYGIGGVGLYVEGGSGTIGGTGIVVKGGTGNVGYAIETHGNVIIKDKSGEYSTIISSGAEGTDINGVKIIDNKVKAQNGFFQTSDARLKNIAGPISVDLDKLSKLHKVYFKWKDNSSSNNEIGMIAQDVQKIYPELVYEDGGHLSLAYDKLSVIALEAIDMLNEKNKELEKRIEKLEQFIK